jgi:hypothetical protein
MKYHRTTRPAPWTTTRTKKPSRKSQRQRIYALVKESWWVLVVGTVCPVMKKIFKRRVPVARCPHHVRGRLGDLLFDTRFFLAVSEEGHAWIHRNVAQARKHGWYAQPGEWNTKPKPENKV